MRRTHDRGGLCDLDGSVAVIVVPQVDALYQPEVEHLHSVGNPTPNPVLAPHLHTLAALIQEQPDRTLAELQVALATSASLATIWRAVKQLGFTFKKNGAGVRTRSARRRGCARAVGDDRADARPDPPRLSR